MAFFPHSTSIRLDYKGIRYMSSIASLFIIYKSTTSRSLVAMNTSTIKGVSFVIYSILLYSYRLLKI